MAATFATFERFKDKGVAAYRNGDYAAARSYLIQAAECMVELAESAKTPQLRQQHETVARELMELAKSCEQRKAGGRRERTRAREDDDSGADAADWVVREKPNIRFDDIAGLDDVKQEIRLKMIYPFQHPELAQRYSVATGGGLLLFGPPGTGKTMIAKAIATEVDATMFVISPAQIMSKWVGEAEQNIKRLFDAAKDEPRACIFMDEVEALVPRRRDSGSSVMTRVVPQILQELEGFDRQSQRPLLFVGATNEPWSLDPAVLRPGRFDARVYVPLPDAPARHRLLELYLGNRPLSDDVDFPKLVDLTDRYSGADIRAVAAKAATIPFLESVGGGAPRPIAMADVLSAIEKTPPSVRLGDLKRFEDYALRT
ncbi:MAG: ATP-binding protein [Phycisphaerae bacterium]|nr:ATP-binding protein [Phycisphaerae bacterium]NUQ45995.1 ATP-binding protein [Phycisphaerae bacterium]